MLVVLEPELDVRRVGVTRDVRQGLLLRDAGHDELPIGGQSR